MSETKKTRVEKIETDIREDDSGYKFFDKTSSVHTDIEDSDRSGLCGRGGDIWIETPNGERIENLEAAYEHIKESVGIFYQHERDYAHGKT